MPIYIDRTKKEDSYTLGLCQKFGVKTIPRIVILAPNGDKLHDSGGLEVSAFVNVLNAHISQPAQETKPAPKMEEKAPTTGANQVKIELVNGALIEGTLIGSTSGNRVTILIKTERASGSITLSKVLIKRVIPVVGKKIDEAALERKRTEYLKLVPEKNKTAKPDDKSKPPDDNAKNTKQTGTTTDKKDNKDPAKDNEDDPRLSELLSKFPPEKGYGEKKYEEYKTYWIKTGSTPPYLDLRTNAPPPPAEVEFYDNYSLWKYARDKKYSTTKEAK